MQESLVYLFLQSELSVGVGVFLSYFTCEALQADKNFLCNLVTIPFLGVLTLQRQRVQLHLSVVELETEARNKARLGRWLFSKQPFTCLSIPSH